MKLLVVQYKHIRYTPVLFIKLKVLALVTVISCITNYVTSKLLIIFWYYLIAPAGSLWKQSHIERYVLVPPEPFLPSTHWFMPATAQLENFYYYQQVLIYEFRAAFNIGQKGHFFLKEGHFFEKRAPKISSPPAQSLLYVFCIKIKFCIIFAKECSIW